MVTTTSYSASSSAMPSGHFTTTVNPIDERGFAYAPGQTYKPASISRPRKVDEGGDLPDPYLDPLGDTPYYLFALLAAAYIAYKRFCKQTA